MDYGLGVDLGTTHTAAAEWVDGRVEIVRLGGRRAEIPSLVFLGADGALLIGEAAERRGATEPWRLAREFKRRVGDPVPNLVGGAPYSAHALMARLLQEVLHVATRRHDGPPAAVTVTHPANWGPYKRELFAQAVHLAELQRVTLRTEPEAAAIRYAAGKRVRPGEVVAVYDLGGGTFDAAVLRKTEAGFTVLGEPEGIEQLGGVDFDEAVFGHVLATLGEAAAGLDPDDEEVVAALTRLRRDCVEAKEALSFDTEALIPVALPGMHTRVRLNRAELEAMIAPALADTIAALRRALRSAGVDAAEVTSILLAGGSSRIPLVGHLVAAEFERPVAFDPDPEHSIALGAALLAAPTATPAAPTVAAPTAGVPENATASVRPHPAPPPEQPAAAPQTSTTRPQPPPQAPRRGTGTIDQLALSRNPGAGHARRRRLLPAVAVAILVAVGLAYAVVRPWSRHDAAPPPDATQPPAAAATAAAATLTLGFYGDLHGDTAVYAQSARKAVELAVAEHTAGHPEQKVDVLPFATGPSSGWPVAIAGHTPRNVIGVIGPSTSGESHSALSAFEYYGVPSITASATDPDLRTRGWHFWHRLVADDYAQLTGLADYLARVYRIKRGYTIDYGGGETANFAGRLADRLKTNGATAVQQDRIKVGGSDIPAIVQRIKEYGPDVVVQYGSAGDTAAVLNGLRDAGVTTPFATGENVLLEPGFAGRAGARADGAVVACSYLLPGLAPGEAAKTFVRRYRQRYGTAPGIVALEAYDAATVFLKAVEAGNTTRADINRFLSTVNVAGLSRTVRFQADGESMSSPVYVYKMRNGALTLLGDAATARR